RYSVLSARRGTSRTRVISRTDAAGCGAMANVTGLWKRTRHSPQSPLSPLIVVGDMDWCEDGKEWKCAAPAVCASSSTAAQIPAIERIQCSVLLYSFIRIEASPSAAPPQPGQTKTNLSAFSKPVKLAPLKLIPQFETELDTPD